MKTAILYLNLKMVHIHQLCIKETSNKRFLLYSTNKLNVF